MIAQNIDGHRLFEKIMYGDADYKPMPEVAFHIPQTPSDYSLKIDRRDFI